MAGVSPIVVLVFPVKHDTGNLGHGVSLTVKTKLGAFHVLREVTAQLRSFLAVAGHELVQVQALDEYADQLFGGRLFCCPPLVVILVEFGDVLFRRLYRVHLERRGSVAAIGSHGNGLLAW